MIFLVHEEISQVLLHIGAHSQWEVPWTMENQTMACPAKMFLGKSLTEVKIVRTTSPLTSRRWLQRDLRFPYKFRKHKHGPSLY